MVKVKRKFTALREAKGDKLTTIAIFQSDKTILHRLKGFKSHAEYQAEILKQVKLNEAYTENN